jgi:hypothetical protein
MLSRMARRLAQALVVALLALGAGCASASKMQVTQDYTRGTDFKPYRTFVFLSPAKMGEWYGGKPHDAELSSYVENAVGRELVAHGLRPVEAAQADLSVAFRVGKHEDVEKVSYGRTYEYDAQGKATAVPIRKEITEGSLLIDLIDARTGKLVWRGSGEGKPERSAIDGTAAAILAQYPPDR